LPVLGGRNKTYMGKKEFIKEKDLINGTSSKAQKVCQYVLPVE